MLSKTLLLIRMETSLPISLYFPCNTITLGGTSKPIAFLSSGNEMIVMTTCYSHILYGKIFLLIIFSCLI